MFATTNFLNASYKMKEVTQLNQSSEDASSQQQNTVSIDLGALGWLPLVSIMMVAVGYHIGLNPIIWSYTGTHTLNMLSRRRMYFDQFLLLIYGVYIGIFMLIFHIFLLQLNCFH